MNGLADLVSWANNIDQGLSTDQLNTVFVGLIVSRLLYALPAWGVLVSAGQAGRIDAFLKRAHKWGFCKDVVTFNELLIKSGSSLFQKMQSAVHCLNSLLPVKKKTDYKLRNRHCNYTLPQCNHNAFNHSFVNWCFLRCNFFMCHCHSIVLFLLYSCTFVAWFLIKYQYQYQYWWVDVIMYSSSTGLWVLSEARWTECDHVVGLFSAAVQQWFSTVCCCGSSQWYASP